VPRESEGLSLGAIGWHGELTSYVQLGLAMNLLLADVRGVGHQHPKIHRCSTVGLGLTQEARDRACKRLELVLKDGV
jgi:hypothetical protein